MKRVVLKERLSFLVVAGTVAMGFIGEYSLAQKIVVLSPKESLEQQSKMAARECIQYLESIEKNKSVLAQQLPIYDAVARLRIEEMANFETYVRVKPKSIFWQEVIPVLYFRWCVEGYDDFVEYASLERNRLSLQSQLSGVTRAIYWNRPEEAFGFLSYLESIGYDAASAFVALRNEAREAGDLALEERASQLLELRSFGEAVTLDQMQNAISDRMWERNQSEWSNLANKFARTNPEEAAMLALQLGSNDHHAQNFLNQAIGHWARKDGLAAFAFLVENGYARRNNSLSLTIGPLTEAMKTDPQAVLNWFDSRPGEENVDQLLVKILSRAAGNREMIPLIQRLPEGPIRRNALLSSVANWGQQDPAQALAWAESNMDEHSYLGVKVGLMPQLFSGSLEDAVAFAESLPSAQLKEQAANRLAYQFAENNFESVLEWSLNNGESLVGKLVLHGLSNRWIEDDPSNALLYAEALPNGALKEQFYRSIGEQLISSRSPEEGLEFAATIENRSIANQIQDRAFRQLAASDAREAQRLFESKEIADIQISTNVAHVIAQNWATQDVYEASEYYLEKANDPNYQYALQAVSREMAYQDLGSAVDWIKELPVSSGRDELIINFIHDTNNILYQTDFVLDAVNQIQDPHLKRQAIEEIERTLK